MFWRSLQETTFKMQNVYQLLNLPMQACVINAFFIKHSIDVSKMYLRVRGKNVKQFSGNILLLKHSIMLKI